MFVVYIGNLGWPKSKVRSKKVGLPLNILIRVSIKRVTHWLESQDRTFCYDAKVIYIRSTHFGYMSLPRLKLAPLNIYYMVAIQQGCEIISYVGHVVTHT